MTVADLIKALQALPQDLPVLRSWEATLIEPCTPRVADCQRYQDSKFASEDYSPELTDESEYTKFKAVILE